MDIYREEVLDHYERPRNQGEMKDPDFSRKDSNASCGDVLEMQFKVKGSVITDIKWKGIGCAISTAAASKMSEWLKGKKVKEIAAMNEEDLVKVVGFEVGPGRYKCLTLPIRIVMREFSDDKSK